MENDDSEEERVNNHRQKKATSMQLKKLQQVVGYEEFLIQILNSLLSNSKFWSILFLD